MLRNSVIREYLDAEESDLGSVFGANLIEAYLIILLSCDVLS